MTQHKLSIPARELYDLAYGLSRSMTLHSLGCHVTIERAGAPLPPDELEATMSIRRSKEEYASEGDRVDQ